MEFETHKKDLETVLESVKVMIEESALDIITKEGTYSPGKTKTGKNLEKMKNLLSYMSKSPEKERKTVM